jgi:uncharacterized protein YecE (DUF72 family)
MKWNIGCSGFSYKEWKDVFYPPGLPVREWFNYYSSRFATLELNVTFYRFPQLAMLQGWYTKSPERFSFAVKAPRLISHYKQFKDCEDLLRDFYMVCGKGLKEKLGPLLFQFPSRLAYDPGILQRIISGMDPSFQNVVEFRDISWWNKKVYAALETKGIIFCGVSYPGLPDEVIVNGPVVYYRFHGIPKLYHSAYDEATLKKMANSVLRKSNVKEVYCYFNNTAAVGAIANARWLEKYTGGLNNKPVY